MPLARLKTSNLLNRQSRLNKGLVACWHAMPGRMGGSIFRDWCGKNHAVFGAGANAPTWSGSKDYQGHTPTINFSSSDSQYADAGNMAAVTEGQSQLSIVLIAGRVSATDIVMCGKGDGTTDICLTLWSDGNCYFEVGPASTYWYAPVTATGTHCWSMVYNGGLAAGSRVIGYQDGVLISGGTQVGTPGTTTATGLGTWRLGGLSSGSGLFGTFRLYECRVYQRALSAREQLAIYRAAKTRWAREWNVVTPHAYGEQSAAPPGGATIPIFDHHYRMQRC